MHLLIFLPKIIWCLYYNKVGISVKICNKFSFSFVHLYKFFYFICAKIKINLDIFSFYDIINTCPTVNLVRL